VAHGKEGREEIKDGTGRKGKEREKRKKNGG